MEILGPFETTWNYQFLLINNNSLRLVKADFWLTFKYGINLQLGIFPNAVEKAKNKIILNNTEQKFINFDLVKEAIFVENKQWKNYLKLIFTDKEIKLNILEREKTDLYKKILKSYLGNKLIIDN